MPKSKTSTKILPISDEDYQDYPLPAIPAHVQNDIKGEYKRSSVDIITDWGKLLTTAKLTSKWMHLSSSRRGLSQKKTGSAVSPVSIAEQFYDNLNSALNGLASDCDDSEGDDDAEKNTLHRRNLPKSSNKALIIYFAKLAQSTNKDDELDLDFISTLIENGADVNTTDTYGQTVFHEVARTWHVDVGKFLLKQNGNINQTDKYGRTPLHVAAAVNYPEMVKFLIENGANVDAVTFNEGQTPVHYAAKNDALESLKMLFKLKCDIEVKDSKGRTPLHVSAELDRSETAMFLVEESVKVGNCDASGLSTLTLMIDKMPPVAHKALDHFHRTDRANRKQYFYLNLLEPIKPGKYQSFTRTPMQSVTINKQMKLLLHPAFQRLIKVKWRKFARFAHMKSVLIQILYVLIWSIIGLTTPIDATYEYTSDPIESVLPRVILEGLGVLLTLFFVIEELVEWRTAAKEHRLWQSWRCTELEADLKFCHPRWPEERKYILQELEAVKTESLSYFTDFWNILDWITYVVVTASVAARIPVLTSGNSVANRMHKRILAVGVIIIWIRLLKFARPYTTLGPFIVMLGNILMASLKFIVLYFGLMIPYVIAFWMNFGGSDNAKIIVAKNQTAEGWEKPHDLIYSTWLITQIGGFDFNALLAVDPILAQVLVGTYTAISAILLLNLYIALLSDTFQRVHDNTVANALMQKAIAINSYQGGMSGKRRDRFLLHIQAQCAPEKVYYDDDDNEGGGELEKMTLQIKEELDDIKETIEGRFHRNPNGAAIELLREEIKGIVGKHKEEMSAIHKKIDGLTYIVQQHLLEDKDPENPGLSNPTSPTGKLPSLYELQLYSQSNNQEEKPSNYRGALRPLPMIKPREFPKGSP